MFFIDHKNELTTFLDPRLPLPDTPYTFVGDTKEPMPPSGSDPPAVRPHHTTVVRQSQSLDIQITPAPPTSSDADQPPTPTPSTSTPLTPMAITPTTATPTSGGARQLGAEAAAVNRLSVEVTPMSECSSSCCVLLCLVSLAAAAWSDGTGHWHTFVILYSYIIEWQKLVC